MGLRIRGSLISYRFSFKGEPVQVATGLENTPENRKRVKQLEKDHRAQLVGESLRVRFQPVAKPSLAECASDFLNWYEARRRRTSMHRVRTSFASLMTFLGHRRVYLITSRDVDDYISWRLNEHKVRQVTVRHDVHALSAFFQWAYVRGLCAENPVNFVDIPSDKDAVRIHVLSDAEIKAYMEAAAPLLRKVTQLILLTGMRPGEVLALKKGDVDLAGGAINVREGKTKAARRTLKLGDKALEIVKSQMQTKGAWLFPSLVDPQQHMKKPQGAHARALEKSGCRFVLYDLRHTFATRMAQMGTDLMTLAAILGHSSTAILFRYVHPSQTHMDSALVKYSERTDENGEKNKE